MSNISGEALPNKLELVLFLLYTNATMRVVSPFLTKSVRIATIEFWIAFLIFAASFVFLSYAMVGWLMSGLNLARNGFVIISVVVGMFVLFQLMSDPASRDNPFLLHIFLSSIFSILVLLADEQTETFFIKPKFNTTDSSFKIHVSPTVFNLAIYGLIFISAIRVMQFEGLTLLSSIFTTTLIFMFVRNVFFGKKGAFGQKRE